MKKYIGDIVSGNFYKYHAYKVAYPDGQFYYLAEPVGLGATRSADTMKRLKQLLEQDALLINCILHKSRTR